MFESWFKKILKLWLHITLNKHQSQYHSILRKNPTFLYTTAITKTNISLVYPSIHPFRPLNFVPPYQTKRQDEEKKHHPRKKKSTTLARKKKRIETLACSSLRERGLYNYRTEIEEDAVVSLLHGGFYSFSSSSSSSVECDPIQLAEDKETTPRPLTAK